MNVSIEVDPGDGHDDPVDGHDSIEAEVDHRMAIRHPINATTRWIKSKLISFYNSHAIWSFVLVCCQIFLLGFVYIYPLTMIVERAARMSLNGNFSFWERLPNQTGIDTPIQLNSENQTVADKPVELYLDTPGGLMILFSINILVQMIAIVPQFITICSHGQRCLNVSHIGCISVAICQFIFMSIHYYSTKENPFKNGYMVVVFVVAIVYLVHFFPRLIMVPVGLIALIIAAFTLPLWIWPTCCCLCCCKYFMVYCKTHRRDRRVTAYYKGVDKYSGYVRQRWEESYIEMRKETKEEKWARRIKRMNKELAEREKIRNKIIKKREEREREERGRDEIELNFIERDVTK